VCSGCGKPDFFTKKNSLLEVDTATGMLRNTDGGTPMVPIGEEDLPSPTASSTAPGGEDVRLPSGRARVFQGGHFKDLHKMLGISSGTEVGPAISLISRIAGSTLLEICGQDCHMTKSEVMAGFHHTWRRHD
jgi:hypothetical protein